LATWKGNDVVYTLSTSVWRRSVTNAMKVVRDLRFGTFMLMSAFRYRPKWGGYKQSGHGASLYGHSLEEFTYIRQFYFDLAGSVGKSRSHQLRAKR
jgi:acyl-CoA reductase-like NAD-dependent aldehyde dehydrogenase